MPKIRRGTSSPAPGRITAFHPPGGPGVRLDTHVYAGYTVPPYYDSLLAKLICEGRDRAEALRRMQIALERFIIEGVRPRFRFWPASMTNPRFVVGRHRHEIPRARSRTC